MQDYKNLQQLQPIANKVDFIKGINQILMEVLKILIYLNIM